MSKRAFNLIIVTIVICLGLFFTACGDIDYNSSNTFINEETLAIDNEYVFKVLELSESNQYELNGNIYDSKYDSGLFLSVKIMIHRKTIENAESRIIDSSWFKLKRGVGFTIWKTSIGETIDANKHIDALESCIEPFEMFQGEDKEIVVVFEIAENYLNTDRILTLEIDRPWSTADAKEIVLINRPEKNKNANI